MSFPTVAGWESASPLELPTYSYPLLTHKSVIDNDRIRDTARKEIEQGEDLILLCPALAIVNLPAVAMRKEWKPLTDFHHLITT
jgi:hypothetical protein